MTESALLLPDGGSLVGVLAAPETAVEPRRPAVILLNAGLVHRVGPNRLYVRIARWLSGQGFSSLRFDLSGIGDSPSRADGSALRDAALRDVRDALDGAAAETGAVSFILLGLCSGADLAFRAALDDARVVGLVLIDGFPYHTFRSRLYRRVRQYALRLRFAQWRSVIAVGRGIVRRLVGARKTASHSGALRQRDVPTRDDAEAGLKALVARGTRLLIIGTPDRDYSYPRHFAHTFPGVRSDRLTVRYFKDADHTFTVRSNQDALIRTINEWISCFT